MRIGKRGLDEGVLNEIKRQLNEKGEVKIKFLKNIVKNKEDFERMIKILLDQLSDVIVVKKIGHTIILRKIVKKSKGKKR